MDIREDVQSLLFFAEYCYEPSEDCHFACGGRCTVDTAVYMPCYLEFTCFWDEQDVTSTASTTTVTQPTTTTVTQASTTAAPSENVSAGTIFGYSLLATFCLGCLAAAIYFGVKKLRRRSRNNVPAVTYQPTSNLNPHPLDRWRFSWPTYPE